MLQAQRRQLRELLSREVTSDEVGERLAKKKRLQAAIDNNVPLPADLRHQVELREKLDLEDRRTLTATEVAADDEFRLAGTYSPCIVVTTSQAATAPCLRFAKELSLMIPNARRVNRGQMGMTELMETCRVEGCTDFIEVSGADEEGRPKLLTICHLPFGPTFYATIKNVTMRSDLAEKPEKMKQQAPHLIFHNFDGERGQRIASCLKYLFPPDVKAPSRRVIAFINLGSDLIHVRHHMVTNNSTLRKFHQKDPALGNMTNQQQDALLERIELVEQGPRFSLEPFKIVRGTPDQKYAEVEWQKAFYIRKAAPVIGSRRA